MSLNSTPKSSRVHIGIFGKRNVGKSSIINGITGQDLAVVSNIKGTTTDPVSKAMELPPIGPVLITDTPGLDDDQNELGELRVKQALKVLNKTDFAILVVDSTSGISKVEEEILEKIKEKNIPYVIVVNKSDLTDKKIVKENTNTIYVSAKTGKNIKELKDFIGKNIKKEKEKPIVSDLLKEKDIVVLVTPIDSSAPKGRLILPQQQVIRDILSINAMPILTKPETLKSTLNSLSKKPKMVITDSQVFKEVSENTPENIPLTSFSILFARYKGSLNALVKGARFLDYICSDDDILISEGCTHHRQCEDIGTVKIPGWIKEYAGTNRVNFHFTSGGEFPEDLSKYKMIVHCGGCMLNEREMQHRIARANAEKVPIVNYGVLIAEMKGILKRALSPFPDLSNLLIK